MKKKAIKIAASTVVAASAFVAAAPANQADAATNVDQLVQDAQNGATVLKWAISIEGSGDGVTQPWAQYNNAKLAVAKAEAAIVGLSFSDKLKYQARLADPKLQVKRAQSYIDAITSSEKIAGLTASLNAAIATNDIEKVEAAYHVATAEYRKQAVLLDRVYGQSTRDQIRNAVKPALEKLVASVKYEVTINILVKGAAADVKAGELEDAATKLTEAQGYLDTNILKWETALQKSLDDVAASMPLTVLSLSADGKNTVTVKFSKEVAAVLPAGQFVFDNGLTVQSAVVSSDRKTVTLTTSNQASGTTYSLAYQGAATGKSFTTATDSANTTFFVDQAGTERLEVGQTRVYKVTVKNADMTNYNGQVTINTNAGGTAEISAINGVVMSGDSATVNVPSNGVLTVVIKGTAGSAASFVPTVVRLDNNDEISLGRTFVYAPAVSTSGNVAQFDGFHNTTANYFAVNGVKYSYDDNDQFNILGNDVSLAQFKAALSYGDAVSFDYKATASATSVWDITTNVSFTPVSFTNPTSKVTYGGTNYRFEGEGNAGYTVYLYNNVTGSLVGTSTVSTSGTWSVQAANLGNAGDTVTFRAVQVAPGQPVGTYDGVADFSIVSPVVVVGSYTVASVEQFTTSDTTVGFGDTIKLDFAYHNSEALNELKVNSTATITLKDSQSKTAVYKVAKTSGSVDTLTIVDVISTDAGFNTLSADTHRIINISGITNQDNLVLTLPAAQVSF